MAGWILVFCPSHAGLIAAAGTAAGTRGSRFGRDKPGPALGHVEEVCTYRLGGVRGCGERLGGPTTSRAGRAAWRPGDCSGGRPGAALAAGLSPLRPKRRRLRAAAGCHAHPRSSNLVLSTNFCRWAVGAATVLGSDSRRRCGARNIRNKVSVTTPVAAVGNLCCARHIGASH